MDESVAQFQRLCVGPLLALETVLTVINVFKFCLEDLSPNGWRTGDNKVIARSNCGLPAGATWPHGSYDQLGQILLRCKEETASFFYYYWGMKLHPFALPEFIQEKRGRGGTNLLTTPTNHRVVAGVGSN